MRPKTKAHYVDLGKFLAGKPARDRNRRLHPRATMPAAKPCSVIDVRFRLWRARIAFSLEWK